MMHTDDLIKNSLAMVVDDDSSLRIVMSAALKKIGLDVIDAGGGNQAIELFKSEKPDIILLDVMMPEIDGFAVCKKIREQPDGQFVQILMVTGLEDVDSTQKAFDVGANGFVTKPMNHTMLGQRVLYMLRAGSAFRELHISQNQLAKTQELAKIGNWQIDFKSDEFNCSSEACILLGLGSNDDRPLLEHFFSTIVPQDRQRVKQTLEKAIEDKKSTSIEYQICSSDTDKKYILNKSQMIYDEQSHPVMMLGIVQDVSQLKQAEEEIRFLAFYDGLTGLANRMLFMDRLEQTIEGATRHKKHFALLFLDLDNFKGINDSLGHHIGDLLLIKIAENIKKSIRGSDSATRLGDANPYENSVIARLGGDEFTILVTELNDPESAAVIARRLLRTIPTTHNFEGNDVSITTSIGISVFPEDGNKAEILLKNADTAMYHAKSEGRNTYQFFMDSMNKAALERFSIDRDLKKALQNNEFVLHYQPQIDLITREIVGAEALIRWYHPHRGMIPPDRFIPIAEESGMIIDINKWVLRTAGLQSKLWIEQGYESLTVAINLSGYKLASQNIVQSVESALKEINFSASRMEIEITENILMQDNEETIATLNKLKDFNLKLALDDFGTGYSSLSYLTSFPVDTIKIDRSFVMGCTTQKNNLVIIKAIIAMGHSLGKKIIAEGIETEEQYHFLRELGCEEGQGYFFSHPVPPAEFEKLLKKGSI